MTTPPDSWSSGERYDAYMGRWSRPIAARFVEWLNVPRGARWLDVGCGTGALTEAVLQRGEPSEVLGIDPSDAYIDHARKRLIDSRVRFNVGDTSHLPGELGRFEAVVSGLVLNFMPDPSAGLEAMTAALAPGGTLGAYIWDYAEGMQFLRYFWDAAGDLDPRARELDEGIRFAPAGNRESLESLFAARLRDVQVEAITVPAVFRNFYDYWLPFLSGQGPAGAYVASLDHSSRQRLRDQLRARLPEGPNGSVPLTTRAWAVRGHR